MDCHSRPPDGQTEPLLVCVPPLLVVSHLLGSRTPQLGENLIWHLQQMTCAAKGMRPICVP